MAGHDGLDEVLAADTLARLPRADRPRDLPRLDLDPIEVGRLTVERPGSVAITVEHLLRRHDTRGLVVLHRGRVAYEWFAGDPARRRPCFSVTKSFTGTLAALAVHEGVLDRNAPVGDLVPDLAASGFGAATVGQVADMTVSVAYTEDYATGGLPPGPSGGATFGFNDYLAALRPAGPWTLRELLTRFRPGLHPHGQVFDYATPKTDVLGWVLETVRNRPYLELLTETFWANAGAGRDGALAIGPCGTPMLGAGLAVTTHDLARAGLALLERTPPSVLVAMRAGGSTAAFARSPYNYLQGYAYADQWWLAGGPNRPLSGWGIHGQVLWIDPDAELVIACHCASPSPSDHDRDLDQDALCRVLTAHVTGQA
jgi:CubicO group peptidase (beta-lactamase class C family)